jgi:preprotein translocase subunit YajC
MVRPQQKRAKEEKTFQDNLSKGDKVMTIGGILGTVESLEDQAVKVRVDANTVIRFTRTAIRPAPAADKKD